MRIAFVVERPTQFEAPFYKHVAETESAHRLAVIFTGGAPAESSFDPELGRQVGWGFDLTSGYPWKAAPASGSASWLEEELGSERPDLVIINGYTQRPYLQALRAAHSLRLPVALRIDSTLFASGARRRWLKAMIFAGFLLPAFDLFFAVGGQSRRYLLAHGVARERIALFPYAVDVAGFASASRQGAAERERLRLDLDLPEDEPVVLALAKLSAREAPWDLLRAAALLGRRAPWLAIAGDGPERERLAAFAQEQGLTRLRWLGYVPYPELPRLYGACDLFVHAAGEERWGVSVEEAMACGLPVVASSQVGAGYDLIRRGGNGWTYPHGDPAALGTALERALRLKRSAVAAVNRDLLERWDYSASWRGILRAAERLTSQRSPTRA